MEEDEQHEQAFGEHTGIDDEVRGYVNLVKDNNYDFDRLVLRSPDVDEFTDLAWTLLGRYILNNTHLYRLDLDESRLTDEKMVSLFSELVSSRSLDRLDLDGNDFGIDGVRSIIPLLQNSPQFTSLWLAGNRRIDSECFEVLVRTLEGKSVKDLFFYQCNITDITALDRYNLPKLQTLNLNGNKIGREGCITISNLLQKEGSTLKTLYLRDMGIGDKEAKIIAASLKHNKKLQELYLSENNLTNEAYDTFFKLLVDISSIESTYTSNHTLIACELNEYNGDMKALNDVCKENKLSSNPEAAGRAKVIKYQLDSLTRKKLCELQGVEYSSIGYIFADMEVNLLPKILALIGRVHCHSEFYTSLLPVAPDLLSFINRKAILEEEKAKNSAQIAELISQAAALTNKNDQIDKRLALIDSGNDKQTAVDGGKDGGGGEKRQRIN